MIVLVGGEKGGSGKSCLAQNLGGLSGLTITARFYWLTVTLNAPHQTGIQERKDNTDLPSINCVQLYGNIREDLLSLKSRYDFVVVDCGGQDNRALRSSMSVASHALIPYAPSAGT